MINLEEWQAWLEKLKNGRLLGRLVADGRERLREVAARPGVHHLANRGDAQRGSSCEFT